MFDLSEDLVVVKEGREEPLARNLHRKVG
jgi:hypothetical protein